MKSLLVSMAVLVLTACGDTVGPDPVDAGPPIRAVPAGMTDPAWASLNKTCADTSAIFFVPQALRAQMDSLTHGPPRSSDDDWADVARTVPGGWGGLFFEQGQFVIYLTDVSKRDAAIASLKSSKLAPFPFDISNASARAGRWNFVYLAEWYRLLTPISFSMAGFRQADINEVKNRLEYTFASASDRTVFEAKLQQLGVPCFLVAIDVK